MLRGARLTAALAALLAASAAAAAAGAVPGTQPANSASVTAASPAAGQPAGAGKGGPSAGPGTPSRPSSCPPVPANQGGPDGEPRTQRGTFPWPTPPAGTDPTDYAAYDHTPAQQPPLRPANWGDGGADWKLTSSRTTDPTVDRNPQELCGVEGNSVDLAWQVTTGRPSTVIAVLDSGIEWCSPGVVDKIYINRRAVPLPENAGGLTKPQLAAQGVQFGDADPYDLNDDGVFNVEDFAADPRVASRFCGGFISPKDLITAFTPLGLESPPGFSAAIAGWNFLDNSNDPYDDVHYDHGTGEAHDSTGAANSSEDPGACPNCMILPVRVGDSFIAYGNDFAQAVLFAVDSGATVIQEALGTLDVTTTAREAVEYANAHGVPIVASAADEEAEHHNLPSLLAHTIVVNSTTHYEEQQGQALQYPQSYLYLNGCTNFGANIAVTVESASCSSEATGKTGGIVGLAESAAADAVQRGTLQPYPGLTSVSGNPVALSSNEVQQLVTMSADDVDFATAAPPYGPPDNYAVVSPVPTTRYPTTPGFDIYTGYGRIDANSIMRRIAAGDIPPEARIDSPQWFDTVSATGSLAITGKVAAVRASSYHWQVQIAQGPAPSESSWVTVANGHGTQPFQGTLATVSGAQLAALFPSTTSLSGGPTSVAGQPDPDRFAFTVRVVVRDNRGRVGMDRRSDYLHDDSSLLPGFPKHFGGSVDAVPTLAPIGPGGTNALIVATTDGDVHAYMPDGSELPGWPVHTATLDYHGGEPGFQPGSGVGDVPHGSIIGGVAVGDLADKRGSALDVVATDITGRAYAWDAQGQMLPGFPVRTLPQFSGPAVRDPHNRVLRGIFAAPVLADLDSNGRLDVVVSSEDRHLYAWHPDGTMVDGYPVAVVDRSVATLQPGTDKVTGYAPGVNADQGSKVMDSPAVGSLDGDGHLQLVVGSNEEYLGAANISIASPAAYAVGQLPILNDANSRVYAFDAHGTLRKGWPVAIADYDSGLLPDVGDGTVNSPALGSVNGGGALQVGVITTVGPGYVLNGDGSSFFGNGPDGKPRVLGMEVPGPLSNSPDHPSLPALGAPVFAPLGPAAPGVSFVSPAVSAEKALDAALAGNQFPHDSQVDAWNLSTGEYQAAFPQVMGDLQFFVQPIVADVGGSSAGPYVIEGSALADVRAIDATGREAPGFPKFTGGWMVNSPSFGAWGSLGRQVLVAGTREGVLFAWSTSTAACADSGPWARGHHDLWNTNNLQTADAPRFQCPGSSSGGGGALPLPAAGTPALPAPAPLPAPLPTVPPVSAPATLPRNPLGLLPG